MWQCRFTVDDPARPVRTVAWVDVGRAALPAGPGDLAVRTLDEQVTTLHAGDRIELSGDPVLIESRS